MCRMSQVTCQVSHVTYLNFYLFKKNVRTKRWSYLVEGLLSTGLRHLVFPHFYWRIFIYCFFLVKNKFVHHTIFYNSDRLLYWNVLWMVWKVHWDTPRFHKTGWTLSSIGFWLKILNLTILLRIFLGTYKWNGLIQFCNLISSLFITCIWWWEDLYTHWLPGQTSRMLGSWEHCSQNFHHKHHHSNHPGHPKKDFFIKSDIYTAIKRGKIWAKPMDTSYFQATEPLNHRTTEPQNHWTTEPQNHTTKEANNCTVNLPDMV